MRPLEKIIEEIKEVEAEHLRQFEDIIKVGNAIVNSKKKDEKYTDAEIDLISKTPDPALKKRMIELSAELEEHSSKESHD
jgi:hypothetical protein